MIDQFADRLRALRAEHGYSLRALAKLVGVTANAVVRWEKAEVTPARDKMIELAEAFGVEAGWLAWGLGERDPGTTADLGKRLEGCSKAELTAVATMLDAFQVEREHSSAPKVRKKA